MTVGTFQCLQFGLPGPAAAAIRVDPVVLAVDLSIGSPADAPAATPVTESPDTPDFSSSAIPDPSALSIPADPALTPLAPMPVVRKSVQTIPNSSRIASVAVTSKIAPAEQKTSGPPVAAGPVYQSIDYGTGTGDQPAPEYPIEAERAGQEGTVVIRFDVDADGRVTAATVAVPSAWPVLNNAAARSIRDNWTFDRGVARHYQVSITYKQKDSQ